MKQETETAAGAGWLLLAGAWLAACIVYSPVLRAPWFYDDADYVLNDPRLNRLELFLPSHWSDPPPPLDSARDGTPYLPGYGKPLIADRYLWRLSFALEKRVLGEAFSPAASHGVNLLIHMACVAALFFALSRLVRLYRDGAAASDAWTLLPGVACLIFAVHPWAAEPVCYVTARNASLGTLFVLLGLGVFAAALQAGRSGLARTALIGASLLCALAAFGCKENLITAPAGYVLAVWPVLWERARVRRPGFVAAGVAASAVVLVVIAWLGIGASERAAGLWAQVSVHGWGYFFEIQNPLVLMTLGDQVLVRRLSIEAGHPQWPLWACAGALVINAALVLFAVLKGRRWPALLGLAWFYLHLAPTNSFLPRPDFLAARNVYLPAAGIATLLAAAAIWLWARSTHRRFVVAGACLALCLYWTVCTRGWAAAFAQPERVWARSAAVAPDHAAVRLNLACAILRRNDTEPPGPDERAEAERELRAALTAEDSPTMQYHTERPKAVRRALAWRLVGTIRSMQGRFAEAEQHFRQSWTLMPALPTWVGWVGAAHDQGSVAHMNEAVAEGQKQWPTAWWPTAARGFARPLGSTSAALSDDARRDLEAAEAAPDERVPELRALQMMALERLVRAEPDSPQGRGRAQRLARLRSGR
jgi:hypothetical protein